MRDKNGRFTRIDVPGAGLTAPIDINDRGQVVGQFQNTDYCPDGADPLRGFLRDRTGRFTIIHVPDSVYTTANGINERGQVVGFYVDAAGTPHGFGWHEGRFTTIDFPDAPATSLTGINNRGQIVGVYGPTTEPVLHGFLLCGGVFATFDAPGVPVTSPLDINDRGQIVGFTIREPSPVPFVGARGFLLAKGAKGPFTPIDFPGASLTAAGGIDDRGRIVGTYQNATAAPDGQPSPMRMPMMKMMMSGL
jgi:probable HAF family extracellular repeat protein